MSLTLHQHIKRQLREQGYTARESRAIIATAQADARCPVHANLWSGEASTPYVYVQLWEYTQAMAWRWAREFKPLNLKQAQVA